MDYEYYQGKLQDIKNALDEGYKSCADNFKKQESLYKDNIYFIDTLMQDITYKKITEDNLAIIQKILRGEFTDSALPSQLSKKDENEKSSIDSLQIQRGTTPDMISKFSYGENIREASSSEIEAVKKFIEAYKAGQLSSNYETLGISKTYAQIFAFMNKDRWKAYQDKDKISLSAKNVNRILYFAHAVEGKSNVYFLTPSRTEMAAFGGTKAIQSAYPAFFDFDMEVCATENKKVAKLIAPAVVVKKDDEYKLYVDKNGKAWKGKIEF
ncbi:MAG: hypothetical protein Q4E64_08690 [Phascolarctobacterium sp.]|uniref:hypothetical protein n=1 Tax=Phascolarctobacterium sp. TaxID=2049039 RepID=UPI0026DAD4BF|nr:hypothetical protein [Phascolarctobacterium sp.]MDO4921882.1 hypothetical protein [Phascolarctobacterium sp.]